MQAPTLKLLKKDVFGSTFLANTDAGPVILRDASGARFPFRWLARKLLAREARALAILEGLRGVPEVTRVERDRLERTYLDGAPMHIARPQSLDYFHGAAKTLRQMHRQGVVHNDLAKEPNLIVLTDGNPAIIDFQLSMTMRRRNRLFRILGREDLRHLLKHKRTYCPDSLTQREKDILANPSVISRVFMSTVKPVYLFITRKLLGWQDREGAGDR